MTANPKGRLVQLFLVDGTPAGIITAEIRNWTGKVIAAPRARLADLLSRPEVKRAGVYFLTGPDPERFGRQKVYIGETENVANRLTDHNKDDSKEFWTSTTLIVGDDYLAKTQVLYLESILIRLAREAKRATLANSTSPELPHLSEPDEATILDFLEQVRMILPLLGLEILKRQEGEARDDNGEEPTLWNLNEVGATAKAVENNGTFTVKAGSTARVEGIPSWDSYKDIRDQLVADGLLLISDDPSYYLFSEDVTFSSPSAAGTVIRAGNTNGRRAWKHGKTGQSYADWQEDQLILAQTDGPDE